jgi:hypothetical protein
MDELARVTGSDAFQVEHWSILMVKPGYIGPFKATATVIGSGKAPKVGVEAVMTDDGAGGRTIASVTASFRRA